MDTSIRAQDSSPVSISTIGEDLIITGNVSSKGELHLNGQVLGDVHCLALVLGENAQLEGNVVAADVMVRGRLIGSVRALRVMLQSTAHVEGDLFCGTPSRVALMRWGSKLASTMIRISKVPTAKTSVIGVGGSGAFNSRLLMA